MYILIYLTILVLLLGGLYVYSRFPKAKKIIKALVKIVSYVRIIMETHKAKKEYQDIALVSIKYGVLLEVISSNIHKEEVVKPWVKKFVKDTIEVIAKEEVPKDEVDKVASSMYALILLRQDLIPIIQSFSNHENIEVKKITVVAIDVIGEMYDLRSKLDRSVFKHIIVGINRSLLFLRDGGYNKKTYTKIGLTLHRLRAIMKSYNSQKVSKGNLTTKQLHERLNDVISSLNKVV